MKILIKETNLGTIMEVHKQIPEFFGETKQTFEKRLNGKETLLLVAAAAGKAAGYLVGYKENRKIFYIWRAGTIPAQRKKGVMTSLMNYAEKYAKKKGFKEIRIKTRNTRRAQLINLVKRGYMFDKVEKGPKPEENRIFLQKEL